MLMQPLITNDAGIMTFFDTLFLGNTVHSWTVALAVAVCTTALLSIVKGIIVRRLRVFAERTATDIDDLFVDLLHRTRIYFLFAVGVFAGSYVLSMNDAVATVRHTVVILLLLLQSAVWGNGLIAYLLTKMARNRTGGGTAGTPTVAALSFISKLVLWSVVVLLGLENLGFDVTALVAGLGVTGIAVALALQNILGDLFASLSIVLDQPFVIGDFIVVDTLQGTVEHIGLKTTRVRSLSGEQIIFSNADLLQSRVRNFKRMQERRVAYTFGVTYQTTEAQLAMIPQIVSEIISTQPDTRFDRTHFIGFGEFALTFEVVYFVTKADYLVYVDIQQAINLALLRRFREEGISFAYPTRTLVMRQEK
jgi:small-conductance mechanosensitive channel